MGGGGNWHPPGSWAVALDLPLQAPAKSEAEKEFRFELKSWSFKLQTVMILGRHLTNLE